MRYGKLLLKAIKKILPTSIGCVIGIVLGYIIIWGIDNIDVKTVLTYILGCFISFIILTGIAWLYEILKINKKDKEVNDLSH